MTSEAHPPAFGEHIPRESCPGCRLVPAQGAPHASVADCWRALSVRDLLERRFSDVALSDLRRLTADLPTGRALYWLAEHDREVWPLYGDPPGGSADSVDYGFYARPDAVERLRRRFYATGLADAVVVERVERVGDWLAVRPTAPPGTVVPAETVTGGERPVEVFELAETTPTGADAAGIVASHVLVRRRDSEHADVLFGYDGWYGERVAVAADEESVPASVERELTAAITAALL
jgi:hypothetical protein